MLVIDTDAELIMRAIERFGLSTIMVATACYVVVKLTPVFRDWFVSMKTRDETVIKTMTKMSEFLNDAHQALSKWGDASIGRDARLLDVLTRLDGHLEDRNDSERKHRRS